MYIDTNNTLVDEIFLKSMFLLFPKKCPESEEWFWLQYVTCLYRYKIIGSQTKNDKRKKYLVSVYCGKNENSTFSLFCFVSHFFAWLLCFIFFVGFGLLLYIG